MPHPVEVTPAALAGMPLPDHGDGDSKHDRGSVVVVGGSCDTPGAVLLAGLAALRAGAGRLQMATAEPCAPALGVALPEARVTGLATMPSGCLDPAEAERIAELARGADAVLLGPGMLDVDAAAPLLNAVAAVMADDVGVLVIDAGALPAAGRQPERIRRLDGRALLMPNPAELRLLGDGDDVRTAAERFLAVIAARDADTTIAGPRGEWYVDRHGSVGLATSGSGDVATGLAAGFLARRADPVTAALWAAAVHGLAGERLGGPGFLARELLDQVPAVLATLTR